MVLFGMDILHTNLFRLYVLNFARLVIYDVS